jgi:DNA mismatch repair protein MutH
MYLGTNASRGRGRIGILILSLIGCSGGSRVVEVYGSLDPGGLRRRATFQADSIGANCIAEVSSGRTDQTVEVYLRKIQEIEGKEVDQVLGASESATTKSDTPTKYVVKLIGVDKDGKPSEEAPIPVGRYKCEALIDGESQKAFIFNVSYANCPVVAIQDGTPCAGFYKPETVCNKNGQSSMIKENCTCRGKWTCN